MTAKQFDALLAHFWKWLTSRKPPFGKLICKLFGHRWRRLTKKEREFVATLGDPDTLQIRRCSRCSAERIAVKRKANPKQENKDE